MSTCNPPSYPARIPPRHIHVWDRDTAWHAGSFDTLDEAAFAHLAGRGCEILILGTGMKQRFPHPKLLKSLMAARIGLEVMDLGSACRTYNILVAEHRTVAAALLFDPA